MFCGCCEPSTVPVPPGCTVCDLLWSGYPADVTATTDDFADVDPGWRLLNTFSADGGTGHPINPIDANAPNAIADYIRTGRMHFFRSPFIVWFDNFRLFSTRAMPPAPLPNTGLGRQPWLSAIRRANLYFPIVQPRKYRFEITVNYPIDSLPRLADIDHRPAIGAVGVFAIGSANFYVFASGLQYFTDNHTGPSLTVGVINQPPPAFPFFNYTFTQSTTVPFGQVRLRFEATFNPQTNTGTHTYYVNDTAILTQGGVPFNNRSNGTDCASFCGQIIHLAAYEPWRWASSPPRSANPQWEWNGFNWLRGGGNAANPGRAAELTPTWSAANNPDGKLWFDNYSFDFVAP